MAKLKIKPSYIFLGLLIFFLCFLRLWKATDWFSFNFDEEYQAFLAWSQVINFHPIWIGVSASNFGFYLGPAFTYLNALLFKISGGDLVSLAIFSPVLGLLTCLSIYYTISKEFSKKSAIYATLIYGFSALINIFDRRFWNPTPIPFITVWLLYSLYKANKDTRWFILTAVLVASSLHVHLSLISFWPLVLFVIFKNIKKISLKTWILSIVSLLLILSPLIVFDLNHNFDNLLGPFRYVLAPKEANSLPTISVLTGNLPMIWRAFSRIWYIKPFTTIQDEMALGVHGNMTTGLWPLSLFSLAIFLWLLIKQKTDKNYRLISLALSSILLAYLIYPGSACEYFLLSFFTLFAMVIGLFLSSFPQKLSLVIICIFMALNTYSVLTISQAKYGLNTRKNLVKETMKYIRSAPYSVEVAETENAKYPQYAGWCFMFRIYGQTPVSCPANDYFGWILNERTLAVVPEYRVIIAEDQQSTSQLQPVKSLSQGSYNIYIFKN